MPVLKKKSYLCFIFGLLGLSSCQDTPAATEVVVVIDSNIQNVPNPAYLLIGSSLDEGGLAAQTFPAPRQWPVSMGLYLPEDADASKSVKISVRLCSTPSCINDDDLFAPLAEQTWEIDRLQSGKSLRLDVTLSQQCLTEGMSCNNEKVEAPCCGDPRQTCVPNAGMATCISNQLNGADLNEFDGDLQADGSLPMVDASLDASEMDAAVDSSDMDASEMDSSAMMDATEMDAQPDSSMGM